MKKFLSFAIIFSAFISCFTGCSKNKSSGDSKVKLELFYYKRENQNGLKELVKKFEEQNPDISIDMLIIPNRSDKALASRAAQKDLPDIIQMQSYSKVFEYAEKGYLINLSGEECIKNVEEKSLPSVTFKGKQYALPMDFAGIGILYNKDIFADAGLSVPRIFSELKEVCSVLKAKNIIPFSGLLKENWSAGHFLSMVHAALLNEKNVVYDYSKRQSFNENNNEQVDENRFFEVIDFYKNNLSPNASEMTGIEQQNDFASGKAAMMVQGLWSYVDAKKINPKLNVGFIPFPVLDVAEKNQFYADVDSVFGISAQSSSEKQKAAKKFLNWLTSKDGQTLWMSEYRFIPLFKNIDYTKFSGPYEDLMTSVNLNGSISWTFAQYPSIFFDECCKPAAQQYLLGNISKEELICTLNNDIKKF